jgi:hypothetical protein
MDHQVIVAKTRKWIEEFVIKYNICPFADLPYHQGRVIFQCEDAPEYESAIFSFAVYIRKLSFQLNDFSNAFLIFPQWQGGFPSFLDLTEYCYSILEEMNLSDRFQLVCFHPSFYYHGESSESETSLTNQSPFPMIHILQVEEVSQAIDSHPNPSGIAEENKKRLKQMDQNKAKTIRNLLNIN